MKKIFVFLTIICLMLPVFSSTLVVKGEPTTVTKNYGTVILTGGFQTGHFPDVWDLTSGNLTISFTYNATGLVDDYGGDAHAWAELGVRSVGYGDFNPTWEIEGAGVWLATDYDWTPNTFDPDPDSPILDLDDKLILQKAGGCGEGDYNMYEVDGEDVEFTPPNPWANYGIWFDRDGVDPWQATYWGAVDGGTYNTNGIYHVVITLHAVSDTEGVAYMTVNGVMQGFYEDGWKNAQPEFYPAGMTFTGDMKHLQVFYGLYGYGAVHTVIFENITVTGVPLLLATVDVNPDTLNLKSKGRWITVYIELPEGYDVNDIDVSTILLNDTVKAESHPICVADHDGDGIPDLMVKFNRQEVIDLIKPTGNENSKFGTVTLTITGKLYNEIPFEGSDVIKVLYKNKA